MNKHTDVNDTITNSPDDTTESLQSRPTTPHQKLRLQIMLATNKAIHDNIPPNKRVSIDNISAAQGAVIEAMLPIIDIYIAELIGPDQVSYSIPKGMPTTTYERLSHQDMLRRDLRLKGGLK